jgi:hypothetical protein
LWVEPQHLYLSQSLISLIEETPCSFGHHPLRPTFRDCDFPCPADIHLASLSSCFPVRSSLILSSRTHPILAHRHVAFFMLSWLRDVFHSSVYVNFDAVPLKDEIQVEPPTPIELQDPYAKVPGSPTVFGSEHASPEDKFSASTSDSYHTWIDPSLVDPPKGRIPAATHNVESVVYRRPGHIEVCARCFSSRLCWWKSLTLSIDDMSLLNTTSIHGNTARVHHSKSPKSASKQSMAKFFFTGPLVDDVSVLGDEYLLAHNPESFAL